MKVSKNKVILSAALAGMLNGAVNLAQGVPQTTAGQAQTAAPNPKHACAGKNECKGTGGCATDGSKKNNAKAAGVKEKHSCAGKNTCKGNGGCATDGSSASTNAKKKS